MMTALLFLYITGSYFDKIVKMTVGMIDSSNAIFQHFSKLWSSRRSAQQNYSFDIYFHHTRGEMWIQKFVSFSRCQTATVNDVSDRKNVSEIVIYCTTAIWHFPLHSKHYKRQKEVILKAQKWVFSKHCSLFSQHCQQFAWHFACQLGHDSSHISAYY